VFGDGLWVARCPGHLALSKSTDDPLAVPV
jgi:hypothetical protein